MTTSLFLTQTHRSGRPHVAVPSLKVHPPKWYNLMKENRKMFKVLHGFLNQFDHELHHFLLTSHWPKQVQGEVHSPWDKEIWSTHGEELKYLTERKKVNIILQKTKW